MRRRAIAAGAALALLGCLRTEPWSGGVGAVLRHRPGASGLVVTEAPADGGAARAGVRVGDEVTAVDGVSVQGAEVSALVARLRGEVGTTVTLRVRRDGVEREVRVERGPYARR